MRTRLNTLLREPLFHFVVIGAALFAVYAAGGDRADDERGSIVVSRGRIDHLAAGFSRAWLRAPAPEELTGLIDDYVREEVYYREALAMRLDRDDTIIRRRLRQKVEFLFEDVPGAEPSDAELEAFLESRAPRFRTEARFTFSHIYLNPRARGGRLDADVRALHVRLQRAPDHAPDTHGDPSLLPASLQSATRRDVEQQFGPEFARALDGLAPGNWHGPIRSTYGVHLVRVTSRVEGTLPALAEVRDAVRRDWLNERRQAASEAHYRKLLSRYTVTVESARR